MDVINYAHIRNGFTVNCWHVPPFKQTVLAHVGLTDGFGTYISHLVPV